MKSRYNMVFRMLCISSVFWGMICDGATIPPTTDEITTGACVTCEYISTSCGNHAHDTTCEANGIGCIASCVGHIARCNCDEEPDNCCPEW